MLNAILAVLFILGWGFLVVLSSTSLVWHVPVLREAAWQAMEMQRGLAERADN